MLNHCDLMKDVEIELRFPLKNPEEFINELNSKAEPDKKEIFQKDTYYVPAHRNFLDNKWPYEWLRLRETSMGASLDYKYFHRENAEKAADYCDEFQTKIESADALRKIFTNLNFKEVIIVEKSRSTWNYKDVEIAVDNIKDLGFYIELELKKDFQDAKEAKQYLFSVLSELNAEVGEEDLKGYPYAILKKTGAID